MLQAKRYGVAPPETLRSILPVPPAHKGWVVLTERLSAVMVLVRVNEQVVLLPLGSVAVNVMVWLPAPVTVEPMAGDCVTVTVPELSEAVASEV